MRKLNLLIALLAVLLVAGSVSANIWVGDLVYCDVDADGSYDPLSGDFPINGATVNMVCTYSDNYVCMDTSTVTGGPLHPSTDAGLASNFANECPNAPWDPNDSAQHDGRYLFNINADCVAPRVEAGGAENPANDPLTCDISVDESTLPVDCDGVVTPVNGAFPLDGNGDNDRCDAGVDGPFPEGEQLSSEGGPCDPNPGTGVYHAVFNYFAEDCMLYNDFGYTDDNNQMEGPTRTLGYWKNHPIATEMFLPIDFCGVTVTEHCEAYSFLSLGGGKLDNFKRQGMAAALNCVAWGCSPEVQTLIDEGSAACAAGDETFDYGTSGTKLDVFNNSGDDLPRGFDGGKAKPKYCK